MPRSKKQFPSYRLHRASGNGVVTLDGRDVYLGPHGTPASREAYARAIATWNATGLEAGGGGNRAPANG